nr:hypothetical protein [Zobellella taiwanensis]
MGQGQGFVVHFPGQQRLLQSRQGHGAFHHDRLGIQAIGQGFAAGAGDVVHALHHAAQFTHQFAQRHTGPGHATGGTGFPLGAAGAMGEKFTAVAGTLQHADHGFHSQGLELAQGKTL